MTGKELEQQFGIIQQYRSRYDKMFSAFISPATEVPRTYNQSDVTAYVIITDSLRKGLRRPDIICLLQKSVDAEYTTKYEDVPEQKIERKPREAKNPEMATAHITKDRSNPIIIQLSQDIGALREYCKMLAENISDLEIKLDIVGKAKKTVTVEKVEFFRRAK